MKKIGAVLFVVGLFFIIGTIGALDVENISICQVIIQSFIGVAFAIVGGAFL